MPFINPKNLALSFSLALCANPAWSGQACKNDRNAITPSSVFTAHGDGTVTHHKTGLMWKVCSEGQTFAMNGGTPTCTGTPSTYNWKGALTQAEGAHFAGKKDWRLPNIHELTSIVERKCINPAINASVFPSTESDHYWSSSFNAHYNSYVWSVDFLFGNDLNDLKNSRYRARLVRTP